MRYDMRLNTHKRIKKTLRQNLSLLTGILATAALVAYIRLPASIPVSPLGEVSLESVPQNNSLVQSAQAVEATPKPLTVEEKIRKAWGHAEGDNAVKVAFCESSLNPYAEHEHSSAKGLFQIIKGTWNGYKCTGSPLNADDNINCAYKIYQANGWGHSSSWLASKGCHGLE